MTDPKPPSEIHAQVGLEPELNPNIYSKPNGKYIQKEVPKVGGMESDQWKDQPYSTMAVVDYTGIIQAMPFLTDFKDLLVAMMPTICLFWYLVIISKGLHKCLRAHYDFFFLL